MKNFKTLIAIFAIALCIFTGCSTLNPVESEVDEETPSMFVTVESSYLWYVVYHRDTKVMYTVSRGYYNMGDFTLLVNPDGTPMLYEGED